jgi:hypothetical protein
LEPNLIPFVTFLCLASVLRQQTVVPEGLEVLLKFEQEVSSKTAKPGDPVKMSVASPVTVNGRTVIAAGTPVAGLLVEVKKGDRLGKKSRIRIALNPVNGITLEPRERKKSPLAKVGSAQLLSGAAFKALGPAGLLGGYLLSGKEVSIKPGDKLRAEVAKTATIETKG